MAKASGALTQVSYITETTYGTTPTTPSLALIPYSSFSVDESKEVFGDSTIRGDRMRRNNRHGNVSVAGDLTAPLSHGTFDPLFESLLRAAWTTNVLKVGSTEKSFTFEKSYLDVSLYEAITGTVVNSCNIEVNLDSEVNVTFGIMAQDHSAATATALDATPTAVTEKLTFVHVDGTFLVGGNAVPIFGLTLNIDNGLDGNYVLGDANLEDISPSRCIVTGELTAYFEDATLKDLFRNNTESSLDFTLSDGTNTLQFECGSLFVNSNNTPIADEDTLVTTLSFEAVYNSSDGSNIVLTRSA